MKKNKRRLESPASITNSGLLLFLREIASNPRAMGAAWPSSKKLAQRIAAQVPDGPGLVIELGGGTGVVTQALLKQGVTPEQLIVVERSQPLAHHLQIHFPELTIIHGDARELKRLLPKAPIIKAVVSSLPLRSLPTELIHAIGDQLDLVLPHGAVYIQFTYSLYKTSLAPSGYLKPIYHELILKNLPPARIDVFSYEH